MSSPHKVHRVISSSFLAYPLKRWSTIEDVLTHSQETDLFASRYLNFGATLLLFLHSILFDIFQCSRTSTKDVNAKTWIPQLFHYRDESNLHICFFVNTRCNWYTFAVSYFNFCRRTIGTSLLFLHPLWICSDREWTISYFFIAYRYNFIN